MKKTIMIVAAVAVLAIIAFLGFRYFGNGNFIGPGTPPPPPPPGLGEKSLTPLSEQPIAHYWTKDELVYLVTKDGRVSRLNAGIETAITDQAIPEFGSAIESPDGNRLLASFGPLSAPTFSILDIEAAKWSPLPLGTIAAAWSPSSAEVAYLTDGASGSTLGTLNVTTLKKIELLRFAGGDFSLSWVNPKKIYLLEKPSAQYPVSSWSFDVAKKTLEPLLVPEPGLSITWDASGSRALKFTNALKENRLTLVTAEGSLIASASFTTLPDKCVVAGGIPASVYCAVPQSIPPGTLLPDDYLVGTTRFSDDIVRWTPDENIFVTIYERGPVAIDAGELTVTLDGKKIRFVNRYDRKLYEIEIGGKR